MKKVIFSLFAILSLPLCADVKGLNVVVVGGGPAGLAAAIEARLQEANVIVIEKREKYTRINTLFLYSTSVLTLEEWGVKPPEMQELYLGDERRGYVFIKYLEESLSNKARELGVSILPGEFKDFVKDEKAIHVAIGNEEAILPYDLLVAADGTHSLVREKLGITSIPTGEAKGALAIVSAENPENKIGVEVSHTDNFFIKKVTIPYSNVLLLQRKPGPFKLGKVTAAEFENTTREVGWANETDQIASGEAIIIENIPISIQRASSFVDKERAVILLGDAAGTASFYRGAAANIALREVQWSAVFFYQYPQDCSFDNYQTKMTEELDFLIKDSEHLFE